MWLKGKSTGGQDTDNWVPVLVFIIYVMWVSHLINLAPIPICNVTGIIIFLLWYCRGME